MGRMLALLLEYEGTRYCGFQVQPKVPTVQGELERALERFLGQHVKTRGASRTDAGAHARGQVVAFGTEASYSPGTFVKALNFYLPQDIRVRGVWEVPEGFDPRRDAASREYHYLILNAQEPSALWRRFAYHVPQPLDVEAMDRAAALLVGQHDFSHFAVGRLRHPMAGIRTVLHASVARKDELVVLRLEGQSFLAGQVRRTAGTLVEVGLGRMEPKEFRSILTEGKPAAGPGLPAHGLFLMRVQYPDLPEIGERLSFQIEKRPGSL